MRRSAGYPPVVYLWRNRGTNSVVCVHRRRRRRGCPPLSTGYPPVIHRVSPQGCGHAETGFRRVVPRTFNRMSTPDLAPVDNAMRIEQLPQACQQDFSTSVDKCRCLRPDIHRWGKPPVYKLWICGRAEERFWGPAGREAPAHSGRWQLRHRVGQPVDLHIPGSGTVRARLGAVPTCRGSPALTDTVCADDGCLVRNDSARPPDNRRAGPGATADEPWNDHRPGRRPGLFGTGEPPR